MSEPIKNRYDFVVLFDVENGNPNGDPDAGNMPRVDQETNLGLVTDVCLKRKIRNYVESKYGEDNERKDGKLNKIYIKEKVSLESNNIKALENYDFSLKDKKITEKDPDIELKLAKFLCENFYDIRTFGAVITTFKNKTLGLNCGQIRGPVQFAFAKSVDPIMPQEITITRLTGATDTTPTMGRKFIVPYALYRVHGFISANLAQKVTGFNEEDLEILWDSIKNMFEDDHSAARGIMSVRKLIVFKHESIFGNAPSNKLFDLIKITKKDSEKPARSYQDYEVIVDKDACPDGVTCEEKL